MENFWLDLIFTRNFFWLVRCVIAAFVLVSSNLCHAHLYKISQNGRYGYIDERGVILIRPEFEMASDFNKNGYAVVTKGGKKGIVNVRGDLTVPPVYDDIFINSESLVPVKSEGRWGFLDVKTNQSSGLKYLEARGFSDGLSLVKIDQYGFFDSSGKFVSLKGKFGYVNNNNNFVINPVFDGGYSFEKGITCVQSGNRWAVINKNGERLSKEDYDKCDMVKEGFVYLEKSRMHMVLDNNGTELFRVEANDIGFVRDGVIAVYLTPFYSTNTKELMIKGKLERGKLFSVMRTIDGRIGFKRNIFDEDYIYTPPRVEEIKELYVSPNGRNVYFMSVSDRSVITEKYFDARGFSEGFAAVQSVRHESKWGYIDTRGKIVIEPQFDAAGDFQNGVAPVYIGEKLGYIDTKGRYVWKPTN